MADNKINQYPGMKEVEIGKAVAEAVLEITDEDLVDEATAAASQVIADDIVAAAAAGTVAAENAAIKAGTPINESQANLIAEIVGGAAGKAAGKIVITEAKNNNSQVNLTIVGKIAENAAKNAGADDRIANIVNATAIAIAAVNALNLDEVSLNLKASVSVSDEQLNEIIANLVEGTAKSAINDSNIINDEKIAIIEAAKIVALETIHISFDDVIFIEKVATHIVRKIEEIDIAKRNELAE